MKTVLFHRFAIGVYRRMFMHKPAPCAVYFCMNVIFLEKLIITSFAFVVCLHLVHLLWQFFCFAPIFFVNNLYEQQIVYLRNFYSNGKSF